jgi:hypothetical protein
LQIGTSCGAETLVRVHSRRNSSRIATSFQHRVIGHRDLQLRLDRHRDLVVIAMQPAARWRRLIRTPCDCPWRRRASSPAQT